MVRLAIGPLGRNLGLIEDRSAGAGVVLGLAESASAAVQAATQAAPGKALAYGRSGARSIITWSLGQRASGALSADALIEHGAAAGYDLSGVLSR